MYGRWNIFKYDIYTFMPVFSMVYILCCMNPKPFEITVVNIVQWHRQVMVLKMWKRSPFNPVRGHGECSWYGDLLWAGGCGD
jgi:hypothetical protein